MATNLEKLKAEIADMSAEKFARLVDVEQLCRLVHFSKGNVNCGKIRCCDCYIGWLNEESEGKEWFI